MVTSWTWATLVDFAGYKPTYLPSDGPEFDYYFSSSRPASESTAGEKGRPGRLFEPLSLAQIELVSHDS